MPTFTGRETSRERLKLAPKQPLSQEAINAQRRPLTLLLNGSLETLESTIVLDIFPNH